MKRVLFLVSMEPKKPALDAFKDEDIIDWDDEKKGDVVANVVPRARHKT